MAGKRARRASVWPDLPDSARLSDGGSDGRVDRAKERRSRKLVDAAMSGAELTRRAQKILHAVITEYLHGGDAVGSRTVTRRHDLGLSPATVRNVMADLEEMGLLEQRHSSAGRVPTATGLRFFIDSLLKVRGLSPREKEEIRERVTAPTPDEVVANASRLLSDLTQHAAVIIAPDPAQQRLERVEFVPLRDGNLIAVLVTTDGRIA